MLFYKSQLGLGQDQVLAGGHNQQQYMLQNEKEKRMSEEEDQCSDQVSNSFHSVASSARGLSTTQQCLRKIMLIITRSNHTERTQTSTGFRNLVGCANDRAEGRGQGQVIQKSPLKNGVFEWSVRQNQIVQEFPRKHGLQEVEPMPSFFTFIRSKEEEENEKIRGQSFNLNSGPGDGLALRLGLPLTPEQDRMQAVSVASHSNLYWNIPREEVSERDLGNHWWDSEAGKDHANNSSIGRQCHLGNNSSVESENLSVFQRSSEGEYDPKNDVNFAASAREVSEIGNSVQNVVDDDPKVNLAECNGKEEAAGSLSNDGTGIMYPGDTDSRRDVRHGSEPHKVDRNEEEHVHTPICSKTAIEGCVEQNEPWKEYSNQCKEVHNNRGEGYGNLDLLVDAISLTTGGFFEAEEKAKSADAKKKRGKKQTQTSPCKRKKIPEVDRDKGTEERPSLSGSSLQQEENSLEESETISGKPKNVESSIFNWYADYEDTAPLVRSKRGRNQVLPLRFRDSVLEPWKRVSRQRVKPSTQENPS